MIERYSRAEMAAIWSQDSRYEYWMQVELAALQAQETLGRVPQGVTEEVKLKAGFDAQRILEIEEEVKHDMIAFLTNLNEHVGEKGRYIHLGMTSSDVIDTALALQIRDAGQQIVQQITTLRATIFNRAKEHQHTACVGRSHGIHAEPTTFGLKLLVWVDELDRHLLRFEQTLSELAVGQISGPVGTYSALEPDVEVLTCQLLGLKPARISTQIIQRDLHAHLINTMALLASSLEKFAIEIRHLQRTEVLEVEEPFTKGQKGSSAMPHKRNPVSSENITGLARMIRSYAMPMMENIALWHERDISHSSVERIIFPDAFILLDYILHRFNTVMSGLQVYPETMEAHLYHKGGLVFSQQLLVALTEKGLSRETAYQLVQTHAMAAWQESQGNFKQRVSQEALIIGHLSDKELEACFDQKRMLRHVDSIFGRFETSPLSL
jgi:adenylosuccinate lyase